MKKLQLNKETITSLNLNYSRQIIGGNGDGPTLLETCLPCVSDRSQVDPRCFTDCPNLCEWTDTCETILSACC